MAIPWPAFRASGAREGIQVTLDDANPEAVLTVTLCDSPQFGEGRPTFCICWPRGSTVGDLPEAIVPPVEIEDGVVAVTLDRQEFVGTDWPLLWEFFVYHESGQPGDENEPPPLLLLASGTILLPDNQPVAVVCNVGVS